MKNWKVDLRHAENNFDWLASITIYESINSKNMSRKDILELNVRLMFMITYCILLTEKKIV